MTCACTAIRMGLGPPWKQRDSAARCWGAGTSVCHARLRRRSSPGRRGPSRCRDTGGHPSLRGGSEALLAAPGVSGEGD